MASKEQEQGRSAIGWPEGLATGAVAGFVFGGPIGAAVGIGQGILAKRLRQNELDAAAADQRILSELDEQQTRASAAVHKIGATRFDTAQAEDLDRRYGSLRALTLSHDPDVRARAMEGLAAHGAETSAFIEDVETRTEKIFDDSVSIMDAAATDMRDRFTKGLDAGRAAQATSEEAHRLLSDPNFNPNSTLGRARLVQLMGSTPREMFADPAGYEDALASLGEGIPFVQQWLAYKAGKMDAADFKFTKDEWRNIFHATNIAGRNITEQVTRDAAGFAMKLDQAAESIGHAPPVSYLDRIVTGKVQEGPSVSGTPGGYSEAQAAPGDTGGGPATAPAGGPAGAPGGKGLIETVIEKLGQFERDPVGTTERAVESGVTRAVTGDIAPAGADLGARLGQQARDSAKAWWLNFKDEQAKRAAENEQRTREWAAGSGPAPKRKRKTN